MWQQGLRHNRRGSTRRVDRGRRLRRIGTRRPPAYDKIIGLDLSDVALDGSLHKSPVAAGERADPPIGPSSDGSGRSSTTRSGIPFGWTVDGANRNDSVILTPTLERRRATGCSEEIETIWLDRGYDSDATLESTRDAASTTP